MVSLAAVRASNQGLRAAIPEITALFVGGTSGMGQSTLCQLALHADRPNAYIIGRSESRAAPVLAELAEINPRGSYTFIETDVTLAKNVDAACERIKRKEDRLNLLFMTPGGIPLTGRKETSEGIDGLFALRYYSRMRFVQNLLPLLESAAPARVISVFGGGLEYTINKDDLDLKHSYSVINCVKHAITMTSLSMEHLAAVHPSVSFAHVYPWLVGTNIYSNSFRPPLSTFYNYVVWPLFIWPFSVDLRESGERHLFHSTSARYPSRDASKNQGVPVPKGYGVATGSNGEVGSGAYLLNWKGDAKSAGNTMQKYRVERMPEFVWNHTTELLDSAIQKRGGLQS